MVPVCPLYGGSTVHFSTLGSNFVLPQVYFGWSRIQVLTSVWYNWSVTLLFCEGRAIAMPNIVSPRCTCSVRVTVLGVCVCLSIITHTCFSVVYTCHQRYSWVSLLTCGFLKKPSIQKLWREKANMLMVELTNIYQSLFVLTCFNRCQKGKLRLNSCGVPSCPWPALLKTQHGRCRAKQRSSRPRLRQPTPPPAPSWRRRLALLRSSCRTLWLRTRRGNRRHGRFVTEPQQV